MEALAGPHLQKQGPTVLVVGDVMCDVYLWGTIGHASSRPTEPIFHSAARCYALGGAAKTAANLRTLGCQVYLLGVVGADAAGRRVRELLRQQGIADTWLLEDMTRPTTQKTHLLVPRRSLLAQDRPVLRLDHESRAPLASPLISRLLRHAEALMPRANGVVCCDYGNGACTPDLLGPLFATLSAAGRPIFVDPDGSVLAHDDLTRYRGATVLITSLNEAERAVGLTLGTLADLEGAAGALLYRSQAQALLITRGQNGYRLRRGAPRACRGVWSSRMSSGMSLFHPPEAPLHIPARARDVLDGAGSREAVIAAFSMGMLSGLSMSETAHLANTAASVAVSKGDTVMVSLSELLDAARQDVLA